MSDSHAELSSYHVVEHLQRDFDGVLDPAEVRACVLGSIADLRGSICAEALHEMAYKLARFRLHLRLAGKAEPVVDHFIGTGRR